MALLDTLEMIDWSSLDHAYGPAEDVPGLLRALADPDAAEPPLKQAAARAKRTVRGHCQWVLWGNVFHQGTVWQASASTVPFLVEILRDGPDDDELRTFLISYLHHLAMGYPEDEFPDLVDPEARFSDADRRTESGQDPDLQGGGEYLVWARDCYVAVEAELSEITKCMTAGHEDTALEAIALVASFPRRVADTTPVLRRIARGQRGQRAGHAIVSLAVLEGAAALEDAETLARSEDPVLARQAACAAILADPIHTSNRSIRLLAGPIDVEDTRSVHAGSLAQLVGRCLARLPEEHRSLAIDAVAAQHRHATPMECLSLTESLLRLAFGNDPVPETAAELAPEQRRAVEAILDHGPFRVTEGEFVNYTSILRHSGLPDSREALTAWLDTDTEK